MKKILNLNANRNLLTIDVNRKSRSQSCPYCGGIVNQNYSPFCSRRCAQLDLGHWLNEDYRIPVIDNDYADDSAIDE